MLIYFTKNDVKARGRGRKVQSALFKIATKQHLGSLIRLDEAWFLMFDFDVWFWNFDFDVWLWRFNYDALTWHFILTLYFDALSWRFILTLYFDALFWRFSLMLYFDALFQIVLWTNRLINVETMLTLELLLRLMKWFPLAVMPA